jgi:ABC-2 type transport system permease protein
VTALLMSFMFGGAIKTGTRGSYINFVVPGIFAAVAAFVAVTTTIGVAADMHQGVMDRLRTLPIAKSSVVTGHVLADLARSLIGLAATVAVGYAVGFRPSAGPGGWAAAVAVILLLTFALSWLAAPSGLLGTSLEVAQQLAAIVVIPVFLSSVLVPTATMPSWLRVFTANQPITEAIDAVRAVLAGQPSGSHLWLAPAELAGVIVIAFTLATALFWRHAAST